MEHYFAVMFEDVRHERILLLLVSSTYTEKLRQSRITDHEIDIIKKLALEKLHRQRILKEHLAMSLLESQLE